MITIEGRGSTPHGSTQRKDKMSIIFKIVISLIIFAGSIAIGHNMDDSSRKTNGGLFFFGLIIGVVLTNIYFM